MRKEITGIGDWLTPEGARPADPNVRALSLDGWHDGTTASASLGEQVEVRRR